MNWEDAIEHPSQRDLPFKIELNSDGNLVMSERSNQHGMLKARLAALFAALLPPGKVTMTVGIQTSDNVKDSDVAWLTCEHWEVEQHAARCATAPAICVELVCKGNTSPDFIRKKALYFEAGAQEVWFCDLLGNMSFYTPAGQSATSPMCPDFPAAV